MKQTAINIALIILIIIFASLAFNQCSVKKSERELKESALLAKAKAEADYLELVKAKTRIDTFYKEGKPQHHYHTEFDTINDTTFIYKGVEYRIFKDSLITSDLTLRASVTANSLLGINYEYVVREKIITQQSILVVHDTLTKEVRKGQLIALTDVGLHSYSLGLQYQTKKRLGFTVRYNWYKDEKYPTAGATYRIF